MVASTLCQAQVREWALITLAGDTLRPSRIAIADREVLLIFDSSVKQIAMDSLKTLSRHKESHFWSGAAYGTCAGLVVGAAVGLASYERPPAGTWAINFGAGASAVGGAVLGVMSGFVIGGIIGAASGGDEEYDISKSSTEEKLKILHSFGK